LAKTEPFDRFAEAYDRWFDEHPDLYAAELAVLRDLVPREGEGMEVGAGSGLFAAPLGIGIGVEPSETMAGKARARGIEILPGTAEDLPFEGERFDFVLMVTTICFVDDVGKSFREIFRVLKPGGCVLLGFVDRESELGKRYLARRLTSRFYKDATFFSTREVTERLQETGFAVSDVRQTLVPGEAPSVILEGAGRGGFVAIKGGKA
jgi:SAM-dependent methyltransferase